MSSQSSVASGSGGEAGKLRLNRAKIKGKKRRGKETGKDTQGCGRCGQLWRARETCMQGHMWRVARYDTISHIHARVLHRTQMRACPMPRQETRPDPPPCRHRPLPAAAHVSLIRAGNGRQACNGVRVRVRVQKRAACGVRRASRLLPPAFHVLAQITPTQNPSQPSHLTLSSPSPHPLCEMGVWQGQTFELVERTRLMPSLASRGTPYTYLPTLHPHPVGVLIMTASRLNGRSLALALAQPCSQTTPQYHRQHEHANGTGLYGTCSRSDMLGQDSGTEAQTTSPVRFRLPKHPPLAPATPERSGPVGQSVTLALQSSIFVAVLGSWPLGEKKCAPMGVRAGVGWTVGGKCVRSGSVAVWAATMHYDLCSRPPMTTTTCSTHTRTHARTVTGVPAATDSYLVRPRGPAAWTGRSLIQPPAHELNGVPEA